MFSHCYNGHALLTMGGNIPGKYTDVRYGTDIRDRVRIQTCTDVRRLADRQADGLADKPDYWRTSGQADWRTGGQTKLLTGKRTDRWTSRQLNRQTSRLSDKQRIGTHWINEEMRTFLNGRCDENNPQLPKYKEIYYTSCYTLLPRVKNVVGKVKRMAKRVLKRR